MTGDFPLPDTTWEPTREFWAAAARGELAIPRCAGCGSYNWYPRDRCRACDAGHMPWTAVSGRGGLFSWAVVRKPLVKPFATKVPYLTGLVALEEDPSVRIVTNLVDCAAGSLRVDQPMRVVFRPLSFPEIPRQVMAPMFTPAE